MFEMSREPTISALASGAFTRPFLTNLKDALAGSVEVFYEYPKKYHPLPGMKPPSLGFATFPGSLVVTLVEGDLNPGYYPLPRNSSPIPTDSINIARGCSCLLCISQFKTTYGSSYVNPLDELLEDYSRSLSIFKPGEYSNNSDNIVLTDSPRLIGSTLPPVNHYDIWDPSVAPFVFFDDNVSVSSPPGFSSSPIGSYSTAATSLANSQTSLRTQGSKSSPLPTTIFQEDANVEVEDLEGNHRE